MKRLREDRGLNQYDVACRLGISQNYYCDIENGVRQKELKVNTLIKLSEILEVPAETLISEEIVLKDKIKKELNERIRPPHIVIKTDWVGTEIFVNGKRLERVKKVSFSKDGMNMPVLSIDLVAADVTIDSNVIPELPEVFRGYYEPIFVSPEE